MPVTDHYQERSPRHSFLTMKVTKEISNWASFFISYFMPCIYPVVWSVWCFWGQGGSCTTCTTWGWRKNLINALLHVLKSRTVEDNILALKLSWWFLMIDSIQGNDESLILISTQISFWASSSSTLVAALLPPRLCLVRYRRCCHQYHLCRCFWWDIAVIVVMFFNLYRQCLQYKQCR